MKTTTSSTASDKKPRKRPIGRPRKVHPTGATKSTISSSLLASLLVPLDEMADVLKLPAEEIGRLIHRKVICPTPGGREVVLVDPAEVYTRLPCKPAEIEIASIKRRGDCQIRLSLREELIEAYRPHFEGDGPGMEPVIVIEVDGDLILVDGAHRIEAATREGRTHILARIFRGTLRLAVMAARRLNFFHGQRLSPAELHRSLLFALDENPTLREALVNQTETVRDLALTTGFSKTALGREGQRLRSQSKAESSGQPATEEEAPTPDLMTPSVPAPPLKSDPESVALLSLLRTKSGTLPNTLGDITADHLAGLAQVVGAGLRLIAIHLGREGLAKMTDVKAALKRHPLPKG